MDSDEVLDIAHTSSWNDTTLNVLIYKLSHVTITSYG